MKKNDAFRAQLADLMKVKAAALNFGVRDKVAQRTIERILYQQKEIEKQIHKANQETLYVTRLSKDDHRAIARIFLSVCNDKYAPDLYVADPQRNHRFIEACRAKGLEASDYELNKALIDARKRGYLPELGSKRFSIELGGTAFAVTAAVGEVSMTFGASIDEMMCHPKLGAEFYRIAKAITPGYDELVYRWRAFRWRKSGTKTVSEPLKSAPKFRDDWQSIKSVGKVPYDAVVYRLREGGKPLFAGGTLDLHRDIDALLRPEASKALFDLVVPVVADQIRVDYVEADPNQIDELSKKVRRSYPSVFS